MGRNGETPFSKNIAIASPETGEVRHERVHNSKISGNRIAIEAPSSNTPDSPASGYYEWKTEGKQKTPFYIHPGEGMMAFAGLYSWWRDQSKEDDDPGRWVLTATILTMDAVSALRDIHDRTPVTLPAEWWSDWLDPGIAGDQSFVNAAVAASVPEAEALARHEVAPIRGDDRAELINPL